MQNSRYKRSFTVQASASGMRGKLAAYRELQDQFGEGLRFYMSLQEAISTLKQQAGDYIMTRTIQKYVTQPAHKQSHIHTQDHCVNLSIHCIHSKIRRVCG